MRRQTDLHCHGTNTMHTSASAYTNYPQTVVNKQQSPRSEVVLSFSPSFHDLPTSVSTVEGPTGKFQRHTPTYHPTTHASRLLPSVMSIHQANESSMQPPIRTLTSKGRSAGCLLLLRRLP